MRMTVNGQVFENPEKIDITFEVDPKGETCGPMTIKTKGGELYLDCKDGYSIGFFGENDGSLALGPESLKSHICGCPKECDTPVVVIQELKLCP